MATKRGQRAADDDNKLKLRIEILDGSRIVDDLEVADIRNTREAKEMLDALQETLEEDFDCDFGDSE